MEVSSEFGAMESVLLLRLHLSQSAATPGQGPQLQAVGGRRLPGLEGHAFGEFHQDPGVDGVGLGALQEGLGEVVCGFGIDDHDLDGWGVVQGEGEIEAVVARPLQADPSGVAFVAESFDELLVAGGGVGDLELLGGALAAFHADCQVPGAHVDAYDLRLLHGGSPGYSASGSPDPAP